MKQLITLLMVLVLTGPFSCSGNESTGANDVGSYEADPAPMKYLEYMYNDESGKVLNNKVAAGYQNGFYSEETREKVNKYLRVPFLEEMAPTSRGSASGEWWQRVDVNPERIAQYLSTPEGKELLVSRLNGQYDNAPQSRYITAIVAIAQAAIEIYGMFAELEAAKQHAQYLKDIRNLQILLFLRVQELHTKQEQMKNEILNKMEEDFVFLKDAILKIQGQIAEQDLIEAVQDFNSFIKESCAVDGIDNDYREDYIRDYILRGYEKMYSAAYDSAVKRLELINTELDEGNKIPFNMLFSDMIFMRELSMTRLSFASTVFSGDQLLMYRANVAQYDLERVEQMKQSLFRSVSRPDIQEYVDEICAFLLSWEINLRSHIEIVNGSVFAEMVGLEDARNQSHGFGTFGDLDGDDSIFVYEYGQVLRRDDGTLLYNVESLVSGETLADLFDTGTSGPLANGTFLRIVENGNNIMDPASLGLTPVYRDLALVKKAPPANQCYLDILSGQFLLPRPGYWSRAESFENLVNSDIKETLPVTETEGSISSELPIAGMFNNALQRFSSSSLAGNVESLATSLNGMRSIKPFGDTETDFSSGTLSTWVNLDSIVIFGADSGPLHACVGASEAHAESSIALGDRDTMQLTLKNSDASSVQASLMINGAIVASSDTIGSRGAWLHIYMIWDVEGLSDGSTVKVFVNGEPVLTVGTALPDWMEFVYDIKLNNSSSAANGAQYCCAVTGHCTWAGAAHTEGNSWVAIDNIKLWHSVVTEEPDFEYNFGTGREAALHVIYGPDNNYRPVLNGSGNGVGYYYLQ